MKKLFNMKSYAFLCWLLAAATILFMTVVGCKNSKNVQYQSKGVCFTILHTREAKNQWSFSIRTIYIRQTVNDKPVWDTAWEYPTKFRYDSRGIKKDTAGNPLIFASDSLVWIGKDSVKWKGIDGVPVDSLLRSFRPRNWKAPKVQNFTPPKTK